MARPKSGRVNISILIRPDQIERLNAASKATGISKSVFVEQALDMYMKQGLTIELFKDKE